MPSTPCQRPVLGLPVRSSVACVTIKGLDCCVSLLRAKVGCCQLVPEECWGRPQWCPVVPLSPPGRACSPNTSVNTGGFIPTPLCTQEISWLFPSIGFSALMLASCLPSGRVALGHVHAFPWLQSTGTKIPSCNLMSGFLGEEHGEFQQQWPGPVTQQARLLLLVYPESFPSVMPASLDWELEEVEKLRPYLGFAQSQADGYPWEQGWIKGCL